MQKDDNQKKQLIVLCCLIVVFLVVGVVKIMGSKNTQASSPAQKQAQVAKETNSEASDEVDVSVKQTEPLDKLDVSVQAPRDPFAPQIVAKSEESQQIQMNGMRPPVSRTPNVQFSLEPLPIQTADGGPLPGPTIDASSAQLRLTGVIEGETKVAIIRGGENTRYIVREGQTIDGIYRVESISKVGVRLKCINNQRTIVLQLGGNNA